MINGTLARYFSSGPLRTPDGVSLYDGLCSEKVWWYHITYLNNIINDLFSDAPFGSVIFLYFILFDANLNSKQI